MQQYNIQHGHSTHLILFFAGWGMDRNLLSIGDNPLSVTDLDPKLDADLNTGLGADLNTSLDADLMICYDYRSLDFDFTQLQSYRSITVVAWSMGVRMADIVLSRVTDLPITQRIAINGTPYPIDEERGIAPIIFNGTLNGLNEQSLLKFYRRMCGSAKAYQQFLPHAAQRSVDDLKEELAAIARHDHEASLQEKTIFDRVRNRACNNVRDNVCNNIQNNVSDSTCNSAYDNACNNAYDNLSDSTCDKSSDNICDKPHDKIHDKTWDRVIIGQRDQIFTPDAQTRAWEGTAAILEYREVAHYDPELFTEWFHPSILPL
ncbi:MAG: pimeloyl-ACP methyl esterase BioG family protein [Bacteroides sp.]